MFTLQPTSGTPRPSRHQAAVAHITETVSAWDGIAAAPHRFGGVEFNLGKVEVGHVHASGLVDIPFTVAMRERLVAAGLAEPHHLLAESGWISFYLGRTGDAEAALRLYRLSYLVKRYRRDKTLTEAAYRAELDALGFGAWA